jgi:hypothetical protein
MTTLAVMKDRIASELRRTNITTQIADAINTAIDAYKYESFYFNSTFVDRPATDDEASNAWMTDAERLIRCRAKLELAINVLRDLEPAVLESMRFEVADALAVLRRSVTNQTTATPGTLAYMKLRIKNEIGRSDIDGDIADAIADAIEAYQDERFYWNETRVITFSTVQDQEFYDESDAPAIASIAKIDYVTIYTGNQPYQLLAMAPQDIEHASTNGTSTGQPSWFCYYGEQIRLYPVPSDAWTVRIGAQITVAAPASDAEANNVWMTKAERLIRNRAKAELYTHVDDIADDGKAAKHLAMAEEALGQLRERTAILTQIGEGRIKAMPF